MKAPKTTWAWAIWLDWPSLSPNHKMGHWCPAMDELPTLYPNRRAARAAVHFDFERVVRVKIVRSSI